MKPSPIFWAVTQGRSKCRVRGDTYADALLRAKQFGFANPDSVVRETDRTVELEQATEKEQYKFEDYLTVKNVATYSFGITKRIVRK